MYMHMALINKGILNRCRQRSSFVDTQYVYAYFFALRLDPHPQKANDGRLKSNSLLFCLVKCFKRLRSAGIL